MKILLLPFLAGIFIGIIIGFLTDELARKN